MKNGLPLPKDRLYVTVYHTDDEAFDIWHKDIGLPQERIIAIGDNKGGRTSPITFDDGDTGPCGPCTEIFMTMVSIFGVVCPVRLTKMATAILRFGTASLCSLTAKRWYNAAAARRRLIQAWGLNASVPSCKGCMAIMRLIFLPS